MVGYQTQEQADSQGNQQDSQHLVFQSCFEGLLSHNPLSRASRLDAPPCGGEGSNGLPHWSQNRLCNFVYISRKPRPVPAPS
jgi:hypothetical protein